MKAWKRSLWFQLISLLEQFVFEYQNWSWIAWILVTLVSADPRQTLNQRQISSFLLAKQVVRVKLPCSLNQAPLHESTFFEFLCGILTSKYVAEAHLSLLFSCVKNSWKNPETNETSFATYLFISKFNNASMSNTTDRYESPNVFTSR